MQKVLLKGTGSDRLGYPITDKELTRMLTAGTAEQVDSANPFIFSEVTKADTTVEVEEPPEKQVYETRDMLAQPGQRRSRRQRRRAKATQQDDFLE